MIASHGVDVRSELYDATTAIDVALHDSGRAHDAVMPEGWTYLWASERNYHYWVCDPNGRHVEIDLRPLLLSYWEDPSYANA